MTVAQLFAANMKFVVYGGVETTFVAARRLGSALPRQRKGDSAAALGWGRGVASTTCNGGVVHGVTGSFATT